MMNRRDAFRLVACAALTRGSLLLAASKSFWNNKEPAEWSGDEIQQLMTKSPWAKEASSDIQMGAMGQRDQEMGGRGGGGRTGGGGMGSPGGGMGGGGGTGGGRGGDMGGGPGRAGQGGPPAGMPQIRAVVRWESAEPVRLAMKEKLPEGSAAHYLISVSGLPMRRPGPSSDGQELRRPSDDRLKQIATLVRKHKDPLVPDRASSSDDGTLLFYFPHEGQPIVADDKEVVFQARMGPMELKARFTLKDMMFHGQLAL